LFCFASPAKKQNCEQSDEKIFFHKFPLNFTIKIVFGRPSPPFFVFIFAFLGQGHKKLKARARTAQNSICGCIIK
jgi:hypothetical protein